MNLFLGIVPGLVGLIVLLLIIAVFVKKEHTVLFMNIDKMVGNDLDTGLTNLKTLLEK